jgi:AraC-like DNA-binding protein
MEASMGRFPEPRTSTELPDGVGPGSGRATEFSTRDPHEAKCRTENMLNCRHTMAVLDRASPFRARVRHASMDGFGLMSSTYGPPVEIVCVPTIPWVTVSFMAGGTAAFTQRGADTAPVGSSRAAVLSYDRGVAMRWPAGTEQLMLTIAKSRIETFLRRLLNEPLRAPVRFDVGLDLDGDGRGVVAAVATLRRALATCGPGGPSPVLAAEVEHSVVSALLFGQRHNYTDAVFAPPALPSSRVVGRVVELIEASTDTAFTVADLAAFAGVSERSLHAAFRRQLGASPMAYVRRLRLERVHEELLRLEPDGTHTVTEVALRHGFAHGGRFAAAYRARFGEPPSDTLRR